jgi:hypothetical protein
MRVLKRRDRKSEKLAAKCVLLVGFEVFTNSAGAIFIFSADLGEVATIKVATRVNI